MQIGIYSHVFQGAHTSKTDFLLIFGVIVELIISFRTNFH